MRSSRRVGQRRRWLGAALLPVVVIAGWWAVTAFAGAGTPIGSVSVTTSGLTATLSGTWNWSELKSPCGPGTGPDRAVGWAVQWGDRSTGNSLLSKGSNPKQYFHVGTATDNTVQHSAANSGLGDCGTAPSGSTAAGTWGPITHTYAHEGTYTACVVIYDVHYNKQNLTILSAPINATQGSFAVASAAKISSGEVLVIDSEQMLVTGVTGNIVSVNRHVNGTSAASHTKGAAVAGLVLASPKELVAGSNGTAYSAADHNSDNSAEQNDPKAGKAQCLPVTFRVTAAPMVTSTAPANGATGVATQSKITINFSRSVNATGSAFNIECPSGTPKSFSQSSTPATTVTLTPSSPLPVSTVCTVTVVASQVTDAATSTPMLANYVFSFTIDSPPTVTSTSPNNGDTGVTPSSTVKVNFSEQVAASTPSFKLECPSGTPVPYSLSASPASSFTLTPTSPLPQTTVCTATVVAAQVSDTDANTPLQADYMFSFTTVDAAPFVQSTTPANGANPVGTNTAPTITFSEPVTLDPGAITLECPTGTPVAFTQSGGPTTFTLTPNSSLPQGTTCTVTVTGSKVHDVDSVDPPDTMAADYSFSFTTDTAPSVTTTSPTNGATAVATNATVTVNFSEPVTASTSSFTLECPSGTSVAYSLSASPASSYTLTPNSALPQTTVCTVTVVAAQIHDVDSADPPDTMPADYSFSFTTVDAAPFVQSTTPTDGATNVNLSSTVKVTFSEPVTLDSGAITLDCPSGTPVAYTLTGGPTTFTLTPNSGLPSGTHCASKVIATKVHDVDTVDPPDTMAADYNFAFDTATAPTVTSTVPTGGATGVATDAAITVNFSQSVDASTSSFDVECPLGTPIAYSLSASPASSYTITPNGELPGGVTCTATVVASQVTADSDGTPMQADYPFSFTTDVPPTVTTTSPTDGATNVNSGSTITVNFSESVNATGSSFSLECPTGTPVPFSVSAKPASSFTLTPTSSLPAGTVCTVTVHAGNVTDVDAGSPMAGDYSFSFTTDAPPTVTTTAPANGATDVNAGSTITINFSKSVTAASGAFSLECPTGTPEPFNTSSSPSSSYTLTPGSPLPGSTVCTIVIDHTKITDASSTGMASDYTFSFTTDTPPAVTTTSPTNGATGVSLASTITVNFSKSVSNSSSFSLECPSGTAISFNTSASPANSYTLTPTSNLPADTICTLTVSASGISDASSTNMTSDYTFSFHTELPPPDAVNDGPSTDYSATGGVPIDISSVKGVLTNDTLWNGSISSYGASTGLEDNTLGTATTTAQGGFVTLNADGSFHYEPPSVPPAGGTDTFKYTLTNTTGSETATVTINVTNQIIFVDSSANSSPETGSLTHPYNSLSDIPSTRNTGGVLFFYSGSYTRSDADGVTMKNNEYLIGQGVSLASNLPFTLAPDSVSLPGSSTNPNVSTTFAGGNAVVLGSGNHVKGITLGAAPGYSLSGSSFGTLSIASTTINNTGAGGAISLSTGAIAASSSLDSVSASPTGSANGASFSSVTGSLPFGAGTMSANSSGPAFSASGGSVSVTDSGSLSQSGGGALLSVASGHTGTLTFQTGTLSATGGTGLVFTNADGTYTLSNGSSLTGGATVSVTNGSSGTMSLNSSPTSQVTVTGSNATVSDSGAIARTAAGQLVDIESNTGGSVSLSGNLSATSSANGVKIASNSGGSFTLSGGTKTITTGASDGVALTSNTGATTTLSGGGLAVTTTSGAGFKATGGGTVVVSGSGNTISSGTGTALDVENTTIGASGLTFQSISANGGSHGIVLDTTGASGGLTVTGNAFNAGSGGSITGITGADLASNNCGAVATAGGPVGVGVFLNSTKNPSFTDMTFPGTFGNFGILGYGVNGFTLDHSTMTGTYGDNVNVDDDTVHFCGLTGSATISNDTISNGAETNLRVVNASGTLNRITLQSDTIGLNQVNGGDGTLLEADGGTMNVTVLDSTFQGSRGTPFDALAQTGATMDLVFGQPGHGNTIHNTHSNIVPFAQDLAVTPSGTETFDINSNHFDSASASQAQGGVIINSALGGASATGYFRNNTIGTSGVANSGSSGGDPALDLESNGGGNLTIDVDNNQMYQWGANGAGFFTLVGSNGTNVPAVNVTATNNTILQPGTFASTNNDQGFQLDAGNNSLDSAFTVCLKFSGNTLNGAGNGQSGGDARFRQRFNNKVDMPGYTGNQDGTAPGVVSYIQSLNPTGPPVVTFTASTSGGGGFFNTPGGAACALPGF